MVIGEDGLLRRIDGVAQLRKLVAELIEPQLPIARQIPHLRESLELLTTEEGLYQLALEEWVLLAARWAGTAKKEGTPANCSRGRETFDCATYELLTQINGTEDDAAARIHSHPDGTHGHPSGRPIGKDDHHRAPRLTIHLSQRVMTRYCGAKASSTLPPVPPIPR